MLFHGLRESRYTAHCLTRLGTRHHNALGALYFWCSVCVTEQCQKECRCCQWRHRTATSAFEAPGH